MTKEKNQEHEKILRVHQNLTKLHNFTFNNRTKNVSSNTNQIRQSTKNQDNIELKNSIEI